MPEKQKEDIGLSVGDKVKMQEAFGNMDKRMAGIAGTLHITREEELMEVPEAAWNLSQSTGKPVVIVVRANK